MTGHDLKSLSQSGERGLKMILTDKREIRRLSPTLRVPCTAGVGFRCLAGGPYQVDIAGIHVSVTTKRDLGSLRGFRSGE